MMQSKIIACFLCLAILASGVGAQEGQPNNSDRLKKKIESINLIYKRTLRRQYEEYIASLEKDIADFKEVHALGGTPEHLKQLDADIERLRKELASAVETARSLRDATGEETAAATQPEESFKGSPNLRCPCPFSEAAKEELPGGVIWCGPAEETKLSVQKFAEYAAPILWFSPDEPLRGEGRKVLPQALPGDIPGPVVYYRISEVVYKQDNLKPDLDNANLELDKINKLTLKYYFYYATDIGFGEHPHDLESVRFDINFTLRYKNGDEKPDPKATSGARYYVANISRVIGAAHGVTWYGNQLDIGKDEKDTSLPITLLIEEGKHATSPDRNADGFYSPGYDVNRRYTDAWGVRDLLGSGELGSAKYEGSMTKPRRPADMIMVRPDIADRSCLLSSYTGAHRGELEKAQDEGYALRRAKVYETAAQQQKRFADELGKPSFFGKIVPKKDKVLGWMESEKFGNVKNGRLLMKDEGSAEVEPKMTRGDGFLIKALRRGLGIERNEEFFDAIPIAYRAEGRQHGFTILPPIIRYQPFFGGYALPKINVMFPGTRADALPGRKASRPIRFSLEAMYTPSASRTFDWYATMGSEWARPDASLDYAARFVQEGGLSFRFNQGNLLLGGRIGLRVTGFAEARSPRFIVEFGTGAF